MADYFLLAIIFIGASLFVFSLFTQKYQIFADFVLRILLGGLSIYCINSVLSGQGIQSGVGISGTSLLTIGILGFPGFLLLYGISAYYIYK